MLGAGDLLKGFRVARNLNRLAVRFVETHKTPGTYPDGGNLYLTVTATGSRRWVFKYKTRRPAGTGSKHRLSREMGLGSWPDIGLAKARDLAGAARKLLADGIDPIDNRRTERSRATGVTFGEVATDLHADKQHGWRNAKHRAAWLQTLQVHGASIWNRPIDSITTADVLTCLRPIWTSHAETASRVRGRMEQVFDAGRVHGAIPQDRPNPGTWKGNLSHMLPTRAKLQRGHHKSMPWKDVPAFLEQLAERQAMSALALRFVILTGSRSGEVMGARWNEIDRASALWTVPGIRMKTGKPHVVPLTSAMLEVVDRVAPLATTPDSFLFPGQKDKKPLSGMAFEMLLRAMGVDATTHGFRSSFRVWAAEATTTHPDIAELCLSHIVGSAVTRAYQRSALIEKRRELLTLWSDYCTGRSVVGANVASFPMKKTAT